MQTPAELLGSPTECCMMFKRMPFPPSHQESRWEQSNSIIHSSACLLSQLEQKPSTFSSVLLFYSSSPFFLHYPISLHTLLLKTKQDDTSICRRRSSFKTVFHPNHCNISDSQQERETRFVHAVPLGRGAQLLHPVFLRHQTTEMKRQKQQEKTSVLTIKQHWFVQTAEDKHMHVLWAHKPYVVIRLVLQTSDNCGLVP